MITFDEQTKTFHLQNDEVSYLLQVDAFGCVEHLYWGAPVRAYHGGRAYPRIGRSFSPNPPGAKDRKFSLDTVLQEFPGYGNGDFREPAHVIRHADGSTVTDFRYRAYDILKGKPALPGLPATFANPNEAETLKIMLEDKLTGLQLTLLYTIFRDLPAISRAAVLTNGGNKPVRIERLMSLNVDFPAGRFELLHLPGAHKRERQIKRETVTDGIRRVDSKRGASSHQENPFLALVRPETTEFQGEAYAVNLVYSGNFAGIVQQDQFGQVRLGIGLNDFGFSWALQPGDTFYSPEAVMAYSRDGLNGMSQTFHTLYRRHLLRGKHKDAERPVLINNWEATYFRFHDQKLLELADEAQKLGIELFVLDDGWFGHRDNDRSSLGDWYEYAGKIRMGIKNLAEEIHKRGLKFGLWFEPEMVSRDSDLFREHPDWALQIPGRGISEGRSQYVLDFSRGDVRENIFRQMTDILDHVHVDYIKWDMNRHMTEVHSALLEPENQGETAHRYMLGLYDFLEKLTSRYPDILFESCSGGGGRFDPGMLYYMPQTWTSDNTDAADRLKIQYGTSLAYPPVTMGAHVSAVPNHQTGRVTPLSTRGDVAMGGNFGYELDLTKCTEDEKTVIREQIAFYKAHRQLFQFGQFYRLISPFEGNSAAWQFVSPDRKHTIAYFFNVLSEAAGPVKILKLAGLDPDKNYRHIETGNIYGGDELMNIGLYLPLFNKQDFASYKAEFEAVYE
ncbi:alpha-galactosidase [Heyndrickxia coagulans]|uniref:Alpha-galactosidase n=1 Tax=Heyndrickxia coagulans TaxID=1398 RepID=A0A150K7V5_HEYCO|nr:alpha-galactosidase [Heyndrickxia coagulans]KYC65679.1 Alpha-galactosidase [Heyndrickxia coagulans]